MKNTVSHFGHLTPSYVGIARLYAETLLSHRSLIRSNAGLGAARTSEWEAPGVFLCEVKRKCQTKSGLKHSQTAEE